MFELNTCPFGRFRRYDFSFPALGHGFSVVPAFGATVLSLRYCGDELLDGCATPDELEAGEWFKSALLFPFPNRLRDGRYRWLGKEYAFAVNERLTNTAIHGFVWKEAFAPTRIELTDEHAEIACRLNYDGNCEAYPFPFTLEIAYSMTYRGLFGVNVWMKSHHTEYIPIGFGWHPYFRRGDCSLKLPPCSRELLDERMLPTLKQEPYRAFEHLQPLDQTVLDDCFRVAENLTLYDLRLKGERHTVTLSLSRTLFPFFQIFRPPHRQSIAVEPMTCLANAFENGEGLVSVPPHGVWSAAFVLQCEGL